MPAALMSDIVDRSLITLTVATDSGSGFAVPVVESVIWLA